MTKKAQLSTLYLGAPDGQQKTVVFDAIGSKLSVETIVVEMLESYQN